MLITNLCDEKFNYEFEKLARLFLPFERIMVVNVPADPENQTDRYATLKAKPDGDTVVLCSELTVDGKTATESKAVSVDMYNDKKESERLLSVCLFYCFNRITGLRPSWGILTGVRPARLFSRTVDSQGLGAAKKFFETELLVSRPKISLCEETYKREENIISLSGNKDISLYISVPFCPTRCSYCSFVSHSVEQAARLIPDYVDCLCRELKMTAETVRSASLCLKTVYIGGGTPTTLSAEQLQRIFDLLKSEFDLKNVIEFTVEAGRPDTINEAKLLAIKNAGVTRISINPQTMNDSVLRVIGRRHTSQQTRQAFELSRNLGFNNINADIIAGLPTDDMLSFKNTLDQIISFSPESVTVHALSVKRAAHLNNGDDFLNIGDARFAEEAVNYAGEFLKKHGIMPYYMYRQSKTVGNLENVGYAKPGFEGYYNVYIMDETHSILAVGASAVTKLRAGDNIKRIFNYKYPYEYISRFDERMNIKKEEVMRFYAENT